jgi:neurotrimin
MIFFVAGWSRPKTKDDSETTDEAEIEPLIIDRGPYFDKSASKNVTALVGKTTYLNCRIRNLGNRTVSINRTRW